jgi:hypothetical protein
MLVYPIDFKNISLEFTFLFTSNAPEPELRFETRPIMIVDGKTIGKNSKYKVLNLFTFQTPTLFYFE